MPQEADSQSFRLPPEADNEHSELYNTKRGLRRGPRVDAEGQTTCSTLIST